MIGILEGKAAGFENGKFLRDRMRQIERRRPSSQSLRVLRIAAIFNPAGRW